MTTPTQTIDFDGLRARALAAVIGNDTDMLRDGIEERPGLAASESSVLHTLHKDVSIVLDAVARVLFPRRTNGSSHDRMVDVTGL